MEFLDFYGVVVEKSHLIFISQDETKRLRSNSAWASRTPVPRDPRTGKTGHKTGQYRGHHSVPDFSDDPGRGKENIESAAAPGGDQDPDHDAPSVSGRTQAIRFRPDESARPS